MPAQVTDVPRKGRRVGGGFHIGSPDYQARSPNSNRRFESADYSNLHSIRQGPPLRWLVTKISGPLPQHTSLSRLHRPPFPLSLGQTHLLSNPDVFRRGRRSPSPVTINR